MIKMNLFTVYFFVITSTQFVEADLNITFFLHLPYDSSPYSNEVLQPAIAMAFRHMNEKYNGTTYNVQSMQQVFPSIYRCDQALSVIGQITARYFFELVEGHPDTAAVIFITGCTEVMVYTTDFTREANVLLVTSVGSESALDNKNRARTLVRFGAYQASDVVDCIISLLFEFSWFHVTLFVDNAENGYYVDVGALLDYYFRKNDDFTHLLISYDSTVGRKEDVEPALMVAKRASRVMILVTPMTHARWLLTVASQLGMTNGEFIYIIAWPFDHPIYGNLSWKYLDGRDQLAREAFSSALIVSTKKPTEEVIKQMKLTGELSPDEQKSFQTNPHFLDTFTALIASAEVIVNASQEGDTTYRDGKALARQFRNKIFHTVAGTVTMDEFGDKISRYCVLSFNTCASQFEEVFLYDPTDRDLSAVSEGKIRWPNPLNRPPPDVPYCGFLNENPLCRAVQQGSGLEALWILCALAVTLVSVFLINRWHRQQDAIALLSQWLIDAADLKPLPCHLTRQSSIPYRKAPLKFQQTLSFPSYDYDD